MRLPPRSRVNSIGDFIPATPLEDLTVENGGTGQGEYIKRKTKYCGGQSSLPVENTRRKRLARDREGEIDKWEAFETILSICYARLQI